SSSCASSRAPSTASCLASSDGSTRPDPSHFSHSFVLGSPHESNLPVAISPVPSHGSHSASSSPLSSGSNPSSPSANPSNSSADPLHLVGALRVPAHPAERLCRLAVLVDDLVHAVPHDADQVDDVGHRLGVPELVLGVLDRGVDRRQLRLQVAQIRH